MVDTDTTRPGDLGDESTLKKGDVFADLRIDGIAGRGGSGVVYTAWDLTLDQPRALKVLFEGLSRDKLFRERFELESRSAASITHPSVVTIHRAGEHAGRLFISMQLVEGETLADLIAREAPLERGRAIAILDQVASAVDFAHSKGLVHRDVKPANVLIDGERAFLTDFGIAKHSAQNQPLTEPGELIGTASYVSPEQVQGADVTGATDVYALGCVAYEMLTGAKPFDRSTRLATLMAHVSEGVPGHPALDAATTSVLRRALAKDPARRFIGASEFVEALRKPSMPLLVRARKPLAAAAALALAAGAVALAVGGNDEPQGSVTKQTSAPEASPPAGVVAQKVKLSSAAVNVTVGDLKVWTSADSTLSGVNPQTGKVDPVIAQPDGTLGTVAVGLGSVWVSGGPNGLLRFDPDESLEPAGLALPGSVKDVAIAPNSVWASLFNGSVARVAPSPLSVTDVVDVGGTPGPLIVDEPFIWVALPNANRVVAVDARTATVEATVKVGHPIDLTSDDEFIWVLGKTGDVTSIDRLSRESRIAFAEDGARAITAGFGRLWFADPGDGSVAVWNTRTRETEGPVAVKGAVDVATGSDGIWVASGKRRALVQVTPEGN